MAVVTSLCKNGYRTKNMFPTRREKNKNVENRATMLKRPDIQERCVSKSGD